MQVEEQRIEGAQRRQQLLAQWLTVRVDGYDFRLTRAQHETVARQEQIDSALRGDRKGRP